MIKLVQNAMTVKKGSLNFVDQNGTVIGFNPRPDGNPISFDVYTADGELLETDGKFIEDYLNGLPCHFGDDGHIIKHGAASEADDKLIISLIPDKEGSPLTLQIICMNSLYYTANFVLSDEDRMFFSEAPAKKENKDTELISEITRVMSELSRVREEVSKSLVHLGQLKKKLIAR